MKAVLLFPGQGAQKVGMGKDLYEAYPEAREMMEKADEALGFSLTKVMFEGPDAELTRTCYCQPRALPARARALEAAEQRGGD